MREEGIEPDHDVRETAIGEGRARVTKYKTVKYRVGDKVFLNEQGSRGLKGPYVIATALDTGTYTLCHEDGKEVEGGAMFSEKVLLPAD